MFMQGFNLVMVALQWVVTQFAIINTEVGSAGYFVAIIFIAVIVRYFVIPFTGQKKEPGEK